MIQNQSDCLQISKFLCLVFHVKLAIGKKVSNYFRPQTPNGLDQLFSTFFWLAAHKNFAAHLLLKIFGKLQLKASIFVLNKNK
jgi:hypothetical protein